MIAGTTFRRRPKHQGGTYRGAALITAVFCLAGQLLAVAHESMERHTVCAEHGETTHIARNAHEQADAARPTAAIDVPTAVVASGHDHCTFAACSSRIESQPIFVVSAAPELAPPAEPGPPPVLEPQTDRILLSAPKIAPPAC